MDRIAYVDGKFFPMEDARIPLDDRSLFFGDAVYDAFLGKNGRILDMQAHIQRLQSNMCALGIAAPLSDSDMERCLLKAASFFPESFFFLYVQISRTAPHRRHAYTIDAGSRLLITAERIQEPDPNKQLTLITTEDRRYGFCHIKTVNLLPNVIASHAAEAAGADEAVFIRNGMVTECAHSNLSILHHGTLFTHPTNMHILPGITRHRLLALCRRLGIKVCEVPFGKQEMLQADSVLISSTSKLCQCAKIIDGITITDVDCLGQQLCERMHEEVMAEMDG